MNQKTILTFLPIVFLICMCVFLLGLYYAYTQNKNSDFFNPSNQTCNYSDESLSLSLDYSCDWSVYNDGISYIDKEYNDMLIKDTLHFFKGDNEVLVQVFKVNPTGSYFILNQDYTFEEINDKIWKLETEIFAPCAASRLITKEQISEMIETGLEVISCGANVPFADREIFFGPIMEHTDKKISLLPDFISNCGIARVFAYLMEARREVPMKDEAIFADTSETIKLALERVYKLHPAKTDICKTAFKIALEQLV